MSEWYDKFINVKCQQSLLQYERASDATSPARLTLA